MTAIFKTYRKDSAMWVENKRLRSIVHFESEEQMHEICTLLKFKFFPKRNEWCRRTAWNTMEVFTIG